MLKYKNDWMFLLNSDVTGRKTWNFERVKRVLMLRITFRVLKEEKLSEFKMSQIQKLWNMIRSLCSEPSQNWTLVIQFQALWRRKSWKLSRDVKQSECLWRVAAGTSRRAADETFLHFLAPNWKYVTCDGRSGRKPWNFQSFVHKLCRLVMRTGSVFRTWCSVGSTSQFYCHRVFIRTLLLLAQM